MGGAAVQESAYSKWDHWIIWIIVYTEWQLLTRDKVDTFLLLPEDARGLNLAFSALKYGLYHWAVATFLKETPLLCHFISSFPAWIAWLSMWVECIFSTPNPSGLLMQLCLFPPSLWSHPNMTSLNLNDQFPLSTHSLTASFVHFPTLPMTQTLHGTSVFQQKPH